ncbi:hypothetical protein C2S51_000547 [Perilla frutescens var. frutescens]|nr:hypothetical protein C2S51_000547 [Perilla frutescens var. frutescens]
MAAYAALVSLLHCIEQIEHHHHSPISLDKIQVESLTEKVTLLQDFINDHFHGRFAIEAGLEKLIADAAYAAEDKIISHMLDQIVVVGQQKIDEYLQKVVYDMDLIKKQVTVAIAIEYDLERERSPNKKISPIFFPQLIRDISKAVARTESAPPYENLIRKIFEDSFPPFAHAEVVPPIFVGDNFPYERVFGREQEKTYIVSKLIGSDETEIQLSVIPILGGSGIGKTTLARVVYEDESVKEHFELRVWVNVEDREFNLKHVARGILKSAMSMHCSLNDLGELDEMVIDCLQSQRCLIAFDGIESMSNDSWLHMNRCWFNFLDLGSKILVTTTSQDVTNLVSKQSFRLSQLSWYEGWSLSRYIAFDTSGGKRDIMPPMPENLAGVCPGIPLLLKVFGSLVRYDQKMRDLLSWVGLLPEIQLGWDASATILLCLWGLPPHLRQCLAYCAIFPKRHVFNKEKIIDMWIAAGLVKPSMEENNLVDIGNTYFYQLLYRLFFTDITRDQYANIIEFRIPSLIHEVAEDVARIVYKEKLGLICSVGEDAAQLSLVSPYKSEHPRTLILSPTLHVSGNLDHSLLDFQELRSLDLSCSGICNLSNNISELRELRYLNLSYTLIERLPDCITDLSLLQTLDLSWCYHLEVLPEGLRNLTLMSHLDLSRCESLSYFPSGIDFLTSLSSMPLFVLGKDRDCSGLRELGMLNQLEGKLEIRNLENVDDCFEAKDAELYQKRLQHLELSWSQKVDGDCFQVLELLQPNQQLKVLSLSGYMSQRFPQWISSINSLTKISIINCGCKKLPSLGQLPFLKELQLKEMINLRRIGPELYGDCIADVAFQSLEQLELYDLPKLLEWSGASTIWAFLSLKSLTIEGCPRLRIRTSFPTLTDLVFSNSNEGMFYYSSASFTSICSLLINDMELVYLVTFHALKKLILRNVHNSFLDLSLQGWKSTAPALEQLDILHCNKLIYMDISNLSLLKKLNVVDCQNLEGIEMQQAEDARLMELVFEDCPELVIAAISFKRLLYLRKLMVRNCSKLTHFLGRFERLHKLQCLSVSGCPRVESDLQSIYPELISGILCIINVGNLKKDSRKVRNSVFDEMKYSSSVPISTRMGNAIVSATKKSHPSKRLEEGRLAKFSG